MEGKVLIANRGEIAIRIMNACKDLGLDYIVVYTDDLPATRVKKAHDFRADQTV